MTYMKYGRNVEPEIFEHETLNRKAIVINWNDVNKLLPSTDEKLKHYVAKAVLAHALIDMKHRIVTEVCLDGIGRLDLYDIDTKTVYEIESKQYLAESERLKAKYRTAGVDIVIISIHGLSGDIMAMQTYLKSFIRPD